MNPAAIIAAIEAVISTAVELAPVAVKLEQVVAPLAQGLWNHLINKKVITQADLDTLAAQVTDLSARIQAPLPPEQSDDV